MAKSVLKILQETLNRFDEKMDVAEFLGIDLKNDEDQPEFEMPPELQQKIQQGEMLIQDLQGKLQQATEALQSKVDDQQIQRDKSAEAADTAIQTAKIKADADLQAKREATDASARTERERIASAERLAMSQLMRQHGMPEMMHEVGELPADLMAEPQVSPIQAMVTGLTEQTAQSTQALAQMIAESSAQNAQSVAQLAAQITQAMTAPKTATLSNGKVITVRTGA